MVLQPQICVHAAKRTRQYLTTEHSTTSTWHETLTILSRHMDHFKAQGTHDASLHIRQFLEASQTGHGIERPDERSPAARLCAETLALFAEAVRTLSKGENRGISNSNRISLERSFGRLKLWSDGHGIARGDVDKTFEGSRKLRQASLKILGSIGVTLTERLVPQLIDGSTVVDHTKLILLVPEVKLLLGAIEDEDGDSSSSDDISNLGDDSIREILEDLHTDTICLMELEPLLKNPILDFIREPDNLATDGVTTAWLPHKTFCKANYERYIRCQQQRDAQLNNNVSNLPMASGGTIDGSEFNDSGIGSSLPMTSSYAETVMSYGDGKDRSTRIPPLPTEGRKGKPFECIACGRSVRIMNNSAWKLHLYGDLQPWVCLDASCVRGETTYGNRNDWISHLVLGHGLGPAWESLDCPLCHAVIEPGKTSITKHLGGHLEEISLGALPSGTNYESEVEEDILEARRKISAFIQTLDQVPSAEDIERITLDINNRIESQEDILEATQEIWAMLQKSRDQLSSAEDMGRIILGALPSGFDNQSEARELLSEASRKLSAIEKTCKVTCVWVEDIERKFLDSRAEKCATCQEDHEDVPSTLDAHGSNQDFKSGIHEDGPADSNIVSIPAADLSDSVEEDQYVLKCACGVADDDGNTIYCENCDTWQHIACYYLDTDMQEVLSEHFDHSCVDCKPRPIDRQRARSIQQRVKQERDAFHRERDTVHEDKIKDKGSRKFAYLPTPHSSRESRAARHRASGSNAGEPDSAVDDDEPRYCDCNGTSYGEMIACDADDCQKEWFHIGCVGLTSVPSANGM
ncbi:hypothetical protein JX265_002825 [Neoarthrinium moseri]|uniref:Zinc finger PHD-type domain-containing protein n=1 Tax=Neoarthrinium moseri TaxID=1658444 RepID=A0A9Q0APN7_9PEZI|nr:hypothetical protein JX265_002825 [Neoarthrinium moseri]